MAVALQWKPLLPHLEEKNLKNVLVYLRKKKRKVVCVGVCVRSALWTEGLRWCHRHEAEQLQAQPSTAPLEESGDQQTTAGPLSAIVTEVLRRQIVDKNKWKKRAYSSPGQIKRPSSGAESGPFSSRRPVQGEELASCYLPPTLFCLALSSHSLQGIRPQPRRCDGRWQAGSEKRLARHPKMCCTKDVLFN